MRRPSGQHLMVFFSTGCQFTFYYFVVALNAHTTSASGSDILLLTPPSSNVSLVEYRQIGGTLDFYFFSGPSPQKVVEQYGALVGLPMWQPSFGFGFHLCRWGYNNLSVVMTNVEKMREANIPLEGMVSSSFATLEIDGE